MTANEKQELIRDAASASLARERASVVWSTHAVQRLVAHRLMRSAVEAVLTSCEVIEDYPQGHRALPDCLVLGFDDDARPIHAVVANDQERHRVLVVTVYRPDSKRWSDDWKTRR